MKVPVQGTFGPPPSLSTVSVDLPVEPVMAANRDVARLNAAAKRRDEPDFQAAFSALTAACNAAGSVPFIRIQRPTAMPFTNQKVQSGAR